MKCDYLVLIPTFNRAILLKTLLASLKSCAGDHKIIIVIMDDGSNLKKHNYPEIVNKYNGDSSFRIRYARNEVNNGRKKFWKTYSSLLIEARKIKFKYVIGLSDDSIICKDFFNRVTSRFRSLIKQDNRIVAMNILCALDVNWELDNYVDGAYIATRRFLEIINFRVDAISSRYFKRDSNRSGVHRQITMKLHHSKYKIAPNQKVSYIRPDPNCDSRLYPKKEFPNRLKTNWNRNFVDGYDG